MKLGNSFSNGIESETTRPATTVLDYVMVIPRNLRPVC